MFNSKYKKYINVFIVNFDQINAKKRKNILLTHMFEQ